MSSRLKNDCSNPPGRLILLKFSQIVAKRQKQEVTKFRSHSLSGFRVAANNTVVWDKNPVGNRVKFLMFKKHCHKGTKSIKVRE